MAYKFIKNQRRYMKCLLRLACSFFLLINANAWATDTFNAQTGVLSIPIVAVGKDMYTNVEVTVGNVISIGTERNLLPYDYYDEQGRTLSISSVSVEGVIYRDVKISVGRVIAVGGVNNWESDYFKQVNNAFPDTSGYLDGYMNQVSDVIAIADINADGLKDVVMHYWSPFVSAGQKAPSSSVCPNRVVFFIQQPNLSFKDETSKYLEGSANLGGCSRSVTVADVNNDGFDDLLYAINQEDGRDQSKPADMFAQIAVLLSNKLTNKYVVSKAGPSAWYWETSIGYDSNNNPFIATGGTPVSPSIQLNGDVWVDVSNRLPALASGRALFFNNASTKSKSEYLFQAMPNPPTPNPYPLSIYGYYLSTANAWQQMKPLQFPTAGRANYTSWTGNTSSIEYVNFNGNKGLFFAGDSCLFKKTPSSIVQPLFVIKGTLIPNNWDGLSTLRENQLAGFTKLALLAASDNKSVELDTTFTVENENTSVSGNFFECLDINGDGFMDIAMYDYSRTGQPIVYLNNKQGAMKRVASSILPPPMPGFSQFITSKFTDFNNDGVQDLLIWIQEKSNTSGKIFPIIYLGKKGLKTD